MNDIFATTARGRRNQIDIIVAQKFAICVQSVAVVAQNSLARWKACPLIVANDAMISVEYLSAAITSSVEWFHLSRRPFFDTNSCAQITPAR